MRRPVTWDADVPAEARPVLRDYLDHLSTGLPVGRRRRRLIVDEIADGLACAVQARMDSDGIAPAEAASAAVAELGDPLELASAFATQLVPLTAHRVGLALIATGPVVGLVWASAYGVGESSWLTKIGDVLSAAGVYPFVLAVAVPAAVISAGGAGVLARWLRFPPAWTGRAAVVALLACLLADATLVTGAVLRGGLMTHPELLGVAVAASLVRTVAVLAATRRMLRLRAAAY
jgi:hypothetical protein